jgi:hypothetical protein
MSEPDNPRWLGEIADELRRDVPVRPAWRARLLDEITRAPKPSAGDEVDARYDDEVDTPRHIAAQRRSITLSPVMGLAAAVLFIALGAGVTYAVLSSRAQSDDRIEQRRERNAGPACVERLSGGVT